jgi:hypothetical protein
MNKVAFFQTDFTEPRLDHAAGAAKVELNLRPTPSNGNRVPLLMG